MSVQWSGRIFTWRDYVPFAKFTLSQMVRPGTYNVLNASWNMNYFLVTWFCVQWQTDRQKAMHKSPPCISTGVLKNCEDGTLSGDELKESCHTTANQKRHVLILRKVIMVWVSHPESVLTQTEAEVRTQKSELRRRKWKCEYTLLTSVNKGFTETFSVRLKWLPNPLIGWSQSPTQESLVWMLNNDENAWALTPLPRRALFVSILAWKTFKHVMFWPHVGSICHTVQPWALNNRQTYRHTDTPDRFYTLDRWRGRKKWKLARLMINEQTCVWLLLPGSEIWNECKNK